MRAFFLALGVGCWCIAALSGCAVMHEGPDVWQVHPISRAGEEVQTLTVENLGLTVTMSDPVSGGMPAVKIGRQKATLTRVPAFDIGKQVPSVTATTHLDATTGASIGDSLEVGTRVATPDTPSLRERIFGK